MDDWCISLVSRVDDRGLFVICPQRREMFSLAFQNQNWFVACMNSKKSLSVALRVINLITFQLFWKKYAISCTMCLSASGPEIWMIMANILFSIICFRLFIRSRIIQFRRNVFLLPAESKIGSSVIWLQTRDMTHLFVSKTNRYAANNTICKICISS